MPGSVITRPEDQDPSGLPPGPVVVVEPRGPQGVPGRPGKDGAATLAELHDVDLTGAKPGDALGVNGRPLTVDRRRRQPGATLGLPVVTTGSRSFGDNPIGQSDGVATSTMYRLRHDPVASAGGIRVLYGNQQWSTASGGFEADGPNPITVRASIELNGFLWPLYFGGKRDVVIEPGGLALSDPVGIELAVGTPIYTRTYVSVASAGQKWPLGFPVMTGNPDEGSSATDLTTTKTGWTFATTAPYGPLQIVADYTGAQIPTIGLLGDSIAHGFGDTPAYKGFMLRGLNGQFGYVTVATDGERADNFQEQNTNISSTVGVRMGRGRRMRLVDGCTHAIVAYGRNDLTGGVTLSALQASLGNIWTALALRGIKVFQATIPPRTASTDAWATTGNQTPHSSEAVRVALNDWIRTTPAPLTGLFEVADTLETARNSGLWKVTGAANAYTADGIHPSQTGHTAAAAAIDTSKFTL